MDCGEQALLPAVREASQDTLVVANGFSCKTQIQHARTGRRALHLSQVMQLARAAQGTPDGKPPERLTPDQRPSPPPRRRAARAVALAAIAAGAVGGGVAVRSRLS
jgi:ferric-dicitrate binding protein FerR (iron transport regulator)